METKIVIDDGGRSKYFEGQTRDCVTRAIAIAFQMDYKEVHDKIDEICANSKFHPRKWKKKENNAEAGVYREDYAPYIESLGGRWVPTMHFGTGFEMHLRSDELPKGRIICRCSLHLVAAIDGVIHDTGDCTREGTRGVYGYWVVPEPKSAV